MSKIKSKRIIINGEKTKYEVTSDGNVFSLNYGNTKKKKMMKQCKDKDGYYLVRLSSLPNHKSTNYRVNRLVASAFIKIPHKYIKNGLTKNDLVVHHIDHDVSNNNVSNLQWCTTKENIVEAEIFGSRKHFSGDDHPNKKITSELVEKICNDASTGRYIIKVLSKKYKVSSTIVYNILYGLNWKEVTSNYDLPMIQYHLKLNQKKRRNESISKYTNKQIIEIVRYLKKEKNQ